MTMSEWWLGSGYCFPAAERVTTARTAQGSGDVEVRGRPQQPKEEVPTLEEFATVSRWPCAGESAVAEWDRRKAVEPPRASFRYSGSAAWTPLQTRPAAEEGIDASKAENRQQHADRPEHVVEEGCGVGRDPLDAVHDSSAARQQTRCLVS